MKSSPTYRMKPNYLAADKLEVGKSYVIAPNGQSYFTVINKTDTAITVEYPKRRDEYRIQVRHFDKESLLYKEKKILA